MPIYAPIVIYGLRLLIVVLQYLPTIEHADAPVVTDFYQFTMFLLLTQSGCLDITVETETEQQQQQQQLQQGKKIEL